MLTVWQAPELARGPLSPAILSLYLEGTEGRNFKHQGGEFQFQSFTARAEPFDYCCRQAMPSLLLCCWNDSLSK